MEKPVKVLYVNGGIMNLGGIESFMMNYFRHIAKEKVHIDFLVHGYKKGAYDDEIIAEGSKIYHVPTKSRHPIQYQRELRKVFESGKYKIVHSHLDAMSGWVVKTAAQCGVPIRIAHSHNTDHLTQNKAKRIVNDMAMNDIHKYATERFACSEAAGKWLFGNDEFKVIKNAIEIDKFIFNPSIRSKIRSELNLNNDDLVLGHVGRFEYQKNHEFLLDVFANIYARDSHYKLIMVGNGSLKEQMQQKAKELQIDKAIRFVDACANVNEYYNAFDLFVFPSHFEGLGIVLFEAQVNGLHCIASNVIPHEVNATGNIIYCPISSTGIAMWCDTIMGQNGSRDMDTTRKVAEAGYSIIEEAKKLEDFYGEKFRQINLDI